MLEPFDRTHFRNDITSVVHVKDFSLEPLLRSGFLRATPDSCLLDFQLADNPSDVDERRSPSARLSP